MKNLILGLDPGTRHTGYGLISVDGDRLTHIASGVIDLGERESLARRLVQLCDRLDEIYRSYPVTSTVVEKIFFAKNADSAFRLGHARGVVLMVAARHNTPVFEYAARFVKKCVTGSGAASKDQVQLLVRQLLFGRTPHTLRADASDALALAITGSRLIDVQNRMNQQLEGEL